MGKPVLVLIFLAIWALVTVLALGYPLVTGKIRVGRSGAEPIVRAKEPGRFWGVLAMSAGGLLAALVALRFMLKMARPEDWASAMRALGL